MKNCKRAKEKNQITSQDCSTLFNDTEATLVKSGF